MKAIEASMWRRPFSLRLLLIAAFIAISAGLTIALTFAIEREATVVIKADIERELAELASQMTDKLDRSVFERYQDVVHLAMLAALPGGQDAVRRAINELQASFPEYAWAGLMDRNGKVLVATSGILEGSDSSQRPMFVQARLRPFIGDVHEAKILARLLPNTSSEPLRFVDIALPVLDQGGQFMGVVAAHLDWQWVSEIRRSVIESQKRKTHTELIILDKKGEVLLGPPALLGKTLSVPPAQGTLEPSALREVDYGSGIHDYVTLYSESQGFRSYPGLGWQVLVRQQRDQAFAPVAHLQRQTALWGAALGMISVVLGLLVAARVTQPLSTIRRAAERLQRGEEYAALPVCKDYREVAVLSTTLDLLVSDLTLQKGALAHQATHDALTGVANRRRVRAYLEEEIAKGPTNELAVFFLDLDRFKRFNDGLGHSMGDDLLKAVAQRLCEQPMAQKLVGRLGGDEFVFIAPNMTRASVPPFASQLLESLQRPYHILGRELHASASIGISTRTGEGDSADQLLKNADSAMHLAKASGRSQWLMYDRQAKEEAFEGLTLENHLREALARREFMLHYQPQVNLRTGAIIGVEALLRWDHPQRGAVQPSDFIPIAEQSRLIVPIGQWVLEEACGQVRRWIDSGLEAVPVAVNLSAVQFQQPDLVEKIALTLREHGLPTGMLKLEITESLLMDNVEEAIRTMKAIRALGVHLSIDDFGTGYSSLSYLKRFPINQVKIDQSFVRDLGRNASDTAIVHAVISLARSLDLEVIAEGVEAESQSIYLVEHGCEAAQGYHLGRPMCASMLGLLLQSRLTAGAEPHIEAVAAALPAH